MATPLTCVDQERSILELFKGLFVRMDDGSFAVRTITTEDGDALTCNEQVMGTETLLRAAIQRIDDDKYAIQVTPVS